MAAHCVKSSFLHLTPYPDERVRVTTWGCVVVWLLVPDDVLLCAAELLLSATWATAGALVAAVEVSIVAACCEPNATQPPSVPATAAAAIADLIFPDNRCRPDVALLAMISVSCCR